MLPTRLQLFLSPVLTPSTLLKRDIGTVSVCPSAIPSVRSCHSHDSSLHFTKFSQQVYYHWETIMHAVSQKCGKNVDMATISLKFHPVPSQAQFITNLYQIITACVLPMGDYITCSFAKVWQEILPWQHFLVIFST